MLKNLNPFVRFIDKNDSVRFAHETAAHDCRLIYVFDGECDMLFGGRRHRIQKGNAVYLPPYVPYMTRGSAMASLWVVHFDLTCQYGERADSLRPILPTDLDTCAKLEQEVFAPFDSAMLVQAGELEELLAEIEKKIVLPSAYARDHASASMKEILLRVLEEHEKETALSPLTKRIIDYVRVHFREAEVTNQQIASLFGYHPYHISRVMRKETGRTLKSYVIFYRLKVAANMLSLTEVPIADIARACGFESQSYFSKMFREEFKTTPGEYRKMHSQCEI